MVAETVFELVALSEQIIVKADPCMAGVEMIVMGVNAGGV